MSENFPLYSERRARLSEIFHRFNTLARVRARRGVESVELTIELSSTGLPVKSLAAYETRSVDVDVTTLVILIPTGALGAKDNGNQSTYSVDVP